MAGSAIPEAERLELFDRVNLTSAWKQAPTRSFSMSRYQQLFERVLQRVAATGELQHKVELELMAS
jgi:hypothetical protein